MSTERTRPPEIPSILQGTPSLPTYKHRVLHKLAAELNVITELVDRIKTCTGLREPDRYGQHYQPDEFLRLAEDGKYREAIQLIATRGRR